MQQAIRQLVATWISASNAGDSEKVLGLMADDVEFFVPGQPPMRGKPEFAKAQRAMSGASIDATRDVQEVKVFGDRVYCWTELLDGAHRGHYAARRRARQAGGQHAVHLPQAGGRVGALRDANMLAVVPE